LETVDDVVHRGRGGGERGEEGLFDVLEVLLDIVRCGKGGWHRE
jgi:hypothetical protein